MGLLAVVTGSRGLIAIGRLMKKTTPIKCRPGDQTGRQARRFLQNYFRGRFHHCRLRLDWTGISPFGRRVYRALLKIPAGRTLTYQDLARLIKKPGASRAVGNALRRNPFLIYVPCHRVIRADGQPGGFAAGIKVKRWLLTHER